MRKINWKFIVSKTIMALNVFAIVATTVLSVVMFKEAKSDKIELASRTQEVARLTNKYECRENIDWKVDYRTIKTVEDSISKWVGKLYHVESVKSWYYYPNINNIISTTVIADGYAFYYITYVDWDKIGNSIYSVGLSCFID